MTHSMQHHRQRLITVLELRTRTPADLRRLVEDPRIIHGSLEHAFPERTARRWGDNQRYLWRFTPSTSPTMGRLVVTSPEAFRVQDFHDWLGTRWGLDDVTGRYACFDAPDVVGPDKVTKGKVMAFRVRAGLSNSNDLEVDAIKALPTRGGMPSVDAWRMWAWTADWGDSDLIIDAAHPLTVTDRRRIEVPHYDGSIVMYTALIDGWLRIGDAQHVIDMLCRGSGQARAFGAGLVTFGPHPISDALWLKGHRTTPLGNGKGRASVRHRHPVASKTSGIAKVAQATKRTKTKAKPKSKTSTKAVARHTRTTASVHGTHVPIRRTRRGR